MRSAEGQRHDLTNLPLSPNDQDQANQNSWKFVFKNASKVLEAALKKAKQTIHEQ